MTKTTYSLTISHNGKAWECSKLFSSDSEAQDWIQEIENLLFTLTDSDEFIDAEMRVKEHRIAL